MNYLRDKWSCQNQPRSSLIKVNQGILLLHNTHKNIRSILHHSSRVFAFLGPKPAPVPANMSSQDLPESAMFLMDGVLRACISATACGSVALWRISCPCCDGFGRIAQLVEQRTEKPSSYHSKALQSVPFVKLIAFFYEGRIRFSCFSHILSSVRPSTCKSKTK